MEVNLYSLISLSYFQFIVSSISAARQKSSTKKQTSKARDEKSKAPLLSLKSLKPSLSRIHQEPQKRLARHPFLSFPLLSVISLAMEKSRRAVRVFLMISTYLSTESAPSLKADAKTPLGRTLGSYHV